MFVVDPAPSRRQLLLAVSPFVGLYAAAYGLTWTTPHDLDRPSLVVVAGAVMLVTVVSLVLVTRRGTREGWTLVSVVLACVSVDLLREGSGSTSSYGSLLLAPIIWQAMRRTRPYVWATIAIAGVANAVPIATASTAAQRAALVRSALLFTLIAVAAAQSIRRLVDERAHLLARLAELASTDALTGLPNRRRWAEGIAAVTPTDDAEGRQHVVALIDLDRFKDFNDRHGHDEGDRLLVEAARAWSAQLRRDDLLVRWGGEEFALLLPDTDGDEARRILDRLRAATPRGQTFSAGFVVETGDAPDRTSRRSLEDADRALYRAKASGRSRSVRSGDEVAPVDQR